MRLNYKSRANPGRISIALVLSYAFDWLILIAAAGVGSVFAIQTPNKRPFSLTNPEISFPFVHKEKVPLWVLGVCTLIIPAIVIAAVCLILVPGPTVSKATPKSLIWRRKLWEWHTGWLGLGLSLASAYVITNGMKNLFGKPRPDLLARCMPDYANVEKYVYANFSTTINLVSAAICTNPDTSTLNDGFRSYPSGHASWSAAALIYLSLFLSSKLAITIPFLAPQSYSKDYESSFGAFPSRAERKAAEKHKPSGEILAAPAGTDDLIVGSRNQAAAPPIYLLVIAVIPWLSSVYISSTRYSDFRHHGFDILFGYFIGTVCAIFAFRYYHLPLTRGAGWSWGPRSRERSFWAGVGVGNYAGSKPRVVNIEQHEMDIESSPIEGRPTNDVGEAESSRVTVKGS